MDRLPVNNSRGNPLNGSKILCINRTLAVNRLPDGIDNPPYEGIANWDLHDSSGPLNLIAFFDEGIFAEENRTDIILLQVENHTHDLAGELQKFTRHSLFKPVYSRNTIPDGYYYPNLFKLNTLFKTLNLFFNNLTYFFSPDFQFSTS